jgi:hypothetical protein
MIIVGLRKLSTVRIFSRAAIQIEKAMLVGTFTFQMFFHGKEEDLHPSMEHFVEGLGFKNLTPCWPPPNTILNIPSNFDETD